MDPIYTDLLIILLYFNEFIYQSYMIQAILEQTKSLLLLLLQLKMHQIINKIELYYVVFNHLESQFLICTS